MSFNIGNWKQRMSGSFVLNNKYDFSVTFPIGSTFPAAFTALAPSNFTTPLLTLQKMLGDRCIQTALPGQATRTSDANRYGLGVHEKMPFTTAFTDLPATFLADNKGDAVHTFWKAWLEHTSITKGSSTTRTYGTIEYKDNLTATVQIKVYDFDGSLITSFYLFEAFPIAMNDAEVSWNDQNKLLSYSVVLTYIDWGFANISAG